MVKINLFPVEPNLSDIIVGSDSNRYKKYKANINRKSVILYYDSYCLKLVNESVNTLNKLLGTEEYRLTIYNYRFTSLLERLCNSIYLRVPKYFINLLEVEINQLKFLGILRKNKFQVKFKFPENLNLGIITNYLKDGVFLKEVKYPDNLIKIVTLYLYIVNILKKEVNPILIKVIIEKFIE